MRPIRKLPSSDDSHSSSTDFNTGSIRDLQHQHYHSRSPATTATNAATTERNSNGIASVEGTIDTPPTNAPEQLNTGKNSTNSSHISYNGNTNKNNNNNNSNSSKNDTTVAPHNKPTRETIRRVDTGQYLSEQYDERLLHRTVADAGRWAYGIILVEVWVMSDSQTHLFRPESGWWIDPVFHRSCDRRGLVADHVGGNINNGHVDKKNGGHNKEEIGITTTPSSSINSRHSTCKICRLVNPNLPNYIAPKHLAPGEGLPGVLWCEARGSNATTAAASNVSHLNFPRQQHQQHLQVPATRSYRPHLNQQQHKHHHRVTRSSDNEFRVSANRSHSSAFRVLSHGSNKTHGTAAAAAAADSRRHRRIVSAGQTINLDRIVLSATAAAQEEDEERDEARDLERGRVVEQNEQLSGRQSHQHQQSSSHSRVAWREVKAIASDPDQPWNPRLQLLAALGLGWAAAVPFHHVIRTDPQQQQDVQGIVMFVAREHVDLQRLRSADNESYLKAASALIGAAYALRMPRQCMVTARRQELKQTLARVRNRIRVIHRTGQKLDQVVAAQAALKQKVDNSNPAEQHHGMGTLPFLEHPPDEATSDLSSVVRSHWKRWWNYLRDKVWLLAVKAKGRDVQPPPAFTYRQSGWTLLGCLVTLASVTRLNVYIVETYGSEYSIVLGPFGAFVSLLYGLTASPAAQPRNAVLGQAIALTISISIAYVDSRILADWMKQTLSVSLAVTAMVKLGIIHPPAGAAAMLFSTGNFGWSHTVPFLLGNIIAIGLAVFVNNLSNKRQYPTSWGIPKQELSLNRFKVRPAAALDEKK